MLAWQYVVKCILHAVHRAARAGEGCYCKPGVKNTMYSGTLGWRTDHSAVQYCDASNVSILACLSLFSHQSPWQPSDSSGTHTPPFPHSSLSPHLSLLFFGTTSSFPLCFPQHLDGCHDIVSFMFSLSYSVNADNHLNMYIRTVVTQQYCMCCTSVYWPQVNYFPIIACVCYLLC